jgi:predicted glycogen debranching enzyme
LLIAADAFVAKRGEDGLTVIAGYPSFADRGRDAMIALPGLTLTSGRMEAAGRILQTAARFCDQGLMANFFPESGETPQFNAVDTSLWFVLATWKYWKASGDHDGVRRLLPVLGEILKSYREGTRHDIHVDRDGLLVAGAANSALTWMDVNTDGYVPTPRPGKAVEVNALWLNALRMVAEMEEKLGRDLRATVILRKLADQVAGSFVKTFWYREGGYLFDVVQGDARDASVRPNQILAVSLPYTALDQAQQQSVLNVVTRHLLTPYGLRTLSPQHEKYAGRYAGNRWQRDGAYHQGTVWPWLIGPYCDAYARVNSASRTYRKEIARFIQPLLGLLEETCLGHISELFDGAPPHRSGGGLAMAWNAAEMLRVYDTYAK